MVSERCSCDSNCLNSSYTCACEDLYEEVHVKGNYCTFSSKKWTICWTEHALHSNRRNWAAAQENKCRLKFICDRAKVTIACLFNNKKTYFQTGLWRFKKRTKPFLFEIIQLHIWNDQTQQNPYFYVFLWGPNLKLFLSPARSQRCQTLLKKKKKIEKKKELLAYCISDLFINIYPAFH